jgi:hypothetical protein
VRPEFPEGPDDDLAEWWVPLEVVAAGLPPGKPYEFFELGDFMVMCRFACARGGPLYEYKHSFTRRYLVLDERGRPWGYVPARRPGSLGRYVRLPSLTVALDRLGLHELPWMKAGLEHERIGPSPFARLDDERVALTVEDPRDPV